jgi:hypothetical protein
VDKLVLEIVKTGLQRSTLLLFTGVLMGVVAGWYHVLTGGESENLAVAIAAGSVPFFALCLLLFPAGIAIQVYWDVKSPEQEQELYSSFWAILAQLLIAAVAGSLSGLVFFVGAAGQIPAVFGDAVAADIVLALYPAIGWGLALAVVGVTVLAAVVLAFVLARR